MTNRNKPVLKILNFTLGKTRESKRQKQNLVSSEV